MALFRKKPSGPSTGNDGDDQLLKILQDQHGPADKPRHWVHYLYTADEPSAREASVAIQSAGWGLQRVDVAAQGPGWVVIAEKHDVVVDASGVSNARRFFDHVANSVAGGDYDGWEASG